jgi:chemotaxis protein CheD
VKRTAAPGTSGSERAVDPGATLVRLPEIYLHPGQTYVATSPAVLKMILGSCVGVFLVDTVAGIGAATHFKLPRCGQGTASPRYGDIAIGDLLQKVRAAGSNPRNVRAKVFGGASMFAGLRDQPPSSIGQIGLRNLETAMDLLAEASIAVEETNVLGENGRKVSMVSNTGEIKLEFVSSANGN